MTFKTTVASVTPGRLTFVRVSCLGFCYNKTNSLLVNFPCSQLQKNAVTQKNLDERKIH